MMKTLQKLGKSLMLPVATLPVAAIMMGIGYWIDPSGWGANNVIAAFLIKAGAALIDNMPILFTVGVSIGMSKDNDGTAALAGIVSWLMVQTLLAPGSVAMFLRLDDVAMVNPAFSKINNQFIGILTGLIGALCYNRFREVRLPDALGFFSGKRCVAIVTAGTTILAAVVLFFVWPVIYTGLVTFGEAIISTGAVGAGIFHFFNRLLIPFGLHHALNSVFWFDIAGINDIGNFWGTLSDGVYGQTGMYLTGFFPIMMFGLPGAALAMYHTAKTNQKKVAAGLLFSAGLACFITGVTEPLEFAFMFLAPGLFLVHALLTGISGFVCTLLPVRLGFNFSAGFIDYILSFKAPMAENPLLILPVGLAFGVVYYVVFRVIIVKFNLKTPGREDDDYAASESATRIDLKNLPQVAATIIEGLGGAENIKEIDNCVTRLRTEVKDYTQVNEKLLKSTGAQGVIRPSKTSVQVIIGTNVQFVSDEVKKQLHM